MSVSDAHFYTFGWSEGRAGFRGHHQESGGGTEGSRPHPAAVPRQNQGIQTEERVSNNYIDLAATEVT